MAWQMTNGPWVATEGWFDGEEIDKFSEVLDFYNFSSADPMYQKNPEGIHQPSTSF